MALEDLHNAFLAFTNPEPDATPDIDSVMTAASKVYEDDISVRDEAVKRERERLVELEKTISDLKQKNYDLLVKSPASTVVPDNANGEANESDDDRAATITINDLFEGR